MIGIKIVVQGKLKVTEDEAYDITTRSNWCEQENRLYDWMIKVNTYTNEVFLYDTRDNAPYDYFDATSDDGCYYAITISYNTAYNIFKELTKTSDTK